MKNEKRFKSNVMEVKQNNNVVPWMQEESSQTEKAVFFSNVDICRIPVIKQSVQVNKLLTPANLLKKQMSEI